MICELRTEYYICAMTNAQACKMLFEYYKNTNIRKFKKQYCGRKLGQGCSRSVYEFKPDPRYVIKITDWAGIESNLLELHIWMELKWVHDLAQWLAPVIWANQDCRVILQRRVEFKAIGKYPKKVPHWFTDLKIQNYGWIGRRFVCADYGGCVITNGFTRRMKTVNWNDVP